ncbi:GINS complex subunit Psf2 [Rhodotorula toruloides]|uniref:DNA replication complex GINS protein PSF2 n=1 Tax=Rhodotorula toruloides TaxID=5286 RepID=A0A511KNP5_RHOTO|nr:GINS complex subunit Psf2 [Rhodotorula toruloides]
MSVHPSRRRGPLPADIEFACLDGASSGWSEIEQRRAAKGKGREGEVEIVPSVRMPVIQGLDGDHLTYGPFNPPQKASVPLWLAVHLKKKRKCRIVAPQWLSVGHLEQTLKSEQTLPEFSDLPRDYLEVSKVLLEVASDDVAASDRVRLLLKDIREARQAKVREGLGAINAVHLGMPNLSALEIAELRPFFALSFQRLGDLDPLAEQHRETEEWWMRDPAGCMEAARQGMFGRQGREGTEDSGFGRYGGF